jgi:peptidoglycan/xylan/chitin deacetylase (PgdA/CDA1 family)
MNGWHIDYAYASTDATTVNYNGSTENIKKPVAYVRGEYLFKDGFEIESQQITNVDTSIVGQQTIEYKSDFLWLSENTEQVVIVVDNEAPVIELTKDDAKTEFGEEYVEEGFVAIDNVDGDITNRVSVTKEGNFITYTVSDLAGNNATEIREIQYVDTIAPTLTLQGKTTVVIQKGKEFKEPGYVAVDKKDGDLSANVVVTNNVDNKTKGTYEITYEVTDEAGNVSTASRTVIVEDKKQKTIYLTFDDGPSVYTNELLDILKEYDVKATFFVVGNTSPEILKRMHDEGHAIGAHSLTHSYKTIYSSMDAYFKDLDAIIDIIEDATGERTKLIRFPGGSSNTVSKEYSIGIMGRIAEKVNEEGYTYFDWNVSSGDAGETKNTKKVFENITKGIEQYTTPVVLQHDTKKFSIDAVEDVILWAFEKGYDFGVLTPEYPIVKHKIFN